MLRWPALTIAIYRACGVHARSLPLGRQVEEAFSA